MKKLIALILTLVMSLSLTAALAEAATETYALDLDTFTLEAGPVWFYSSYDAAENKIASLFATPDFGDNWQFSAEPSADQCYHSICEWDEGIYAMPGTWIGENIDILVCFKAPKAGTVVIAPVEFAIKDDGNTWPAYLVRISKSAEAEGEYDVIFPAEEGKEWAETPVITEAIEVEVQEGTEILFAVRSSDDGGAAVSVMPVISYK